MDIRKIITMATSLVFSLISSSTFAAVTTSNYQYDDLGRVKIINSIGAYVTSYDYDAADNRTSKIVQISPPASSVTISDLYIGNKSSTGTSSYKLRSDGFIEIV